MRLRFSLSAAAFVLAAGVLASGCGTDDGGPVLDAGLKPCEVQDTFGGLYTQIFSQPDTPQAAKLCALGGCHGNSGTSGNLDMSGTKDEVYDVLLQGATADPAASAMIPNRIKPNDLMGSFLWRKVSEAEPPGAGSRMPLGGSPLSKCQLDAIKGWIEAGAMND